MILKDNNDNIEPIKHIRGPIKYYPDTFQEVEINPRTNLKFFPCIEINTNNAIHLQRADGFVELVDAPQFYMPEVGETVLAQPRRTVLLMTDFCMIKSPLGAIFVMNGRDASISLLLSAALLRIRILSLREGGDNFVNSASVAFPCI